MSGQRRRPVVSRDLEHSSYLGFPLEITATEVLVRTPAGRKVGRVASVKSARLLVRAYRRALKPGSGSRVERAVDDLVGNGLCADDQWTGVKETC